jgi:S-adenosylmethionine decarboxylase
MRKITKPHIYTIPPNPETFDKGGVSGYILIATSHISIHTFISQEFVSIDIFSCREFDIEEAIKYLVENFEAKKIDREVIMRGKEFIK